ncbi:hypothetical protein EFA46_003470 [Halarchaeum sp. CBA1220]|uniref:hypothetical protein n=1 Tax=Halarchaeum sp. CBA1220 TaxID=1853682 RepID=UPI000F6B17E7|nr:hypothetical protein [Halarchaeum sp. CBA1220]QLC33305.1 hypothetical protein EFA46_003470 [Halarchaeum sp. CBA1220]
MLSTIKKRVFNEPTGRPESVFYFGLAVAFLSLYVYLKWILGSADPLFFPLVMGVGFMLQTVAESRPESQRQTAGVLRLMAMLMFLCGLVVTVFAPGFLFG